MDTGPLPTIVSTKLDFQLLLPGSRDVAVPAALDYSADEPYSIRATFHTGEADVSWVFARELLVEGMGGPAGCGDISVWPGRHQGQEVLFLSLSSDTGQAMLRTDTDEIRRFVNRTFEVVPTGRESDLIDMDVVINRLLANGSGEL